MEIYCYLGLIGWLFLVVIFCLVASSHEFPLPPTRHLTGNDNEGALAVLPRLILCNSAFWFRVRETGNSIIVLALSACVCCCLYLPCSVCLSVCLLLVVW